MPDVYDALIEDGIALNVKRTRLRQLLERPERTNEEDRELIAAVKWLLEDSWDLSYLDSMFYNCLYLQFGSTPTGINASGDSSRTGSFELKDQPNIRTILRGVREAAQKWNEEIVGC